LCSAQVRLERNERRALVVRVSVRAFVLTRTLDAPRQCARPPRRINRHRRTQRNRRAVALQLNAAHAPILDDEAAALRLFQHLDANRARAQQQALIHLCATQAQRIWLRAGSVAIGLCIDHSRALSEPSARHGDLAPAARVEVRRRDARAAGRAHLFEHAQLCEVREALGRDELAAQLRARKLLLLRDEHTRARHSQTDRRARARRPATDDEHVVIIRIVVPLVHARQVYYRIVTPCCRSAPTDTENAAAPRSVSGPLARPSVATRVAESCAGSRARRLRGSAGCAETVCRWSCKNNRPPDDDADRSRRCAAGPRARTRARREQYLRRGSDA